MAKRTDFIYSLTEKEQEQILMSLMSCLSVSDNKGYYDALNDAMGGRLCDIEDMIDIKPYLTKEVKDRTQR